MVGRANSKVRRRCSSQLRGQSDVAAQSRSESPKRATFDGPKTDGGKAKSSQNSIKHGIFVTKFLNGATPETVAEADELAAGLREYYTNQAGLTRNSTANRFSRA